MISVLISQKAAKEVEELERTGKMPENPKTEDKKSPLFHPQQQHWQPNY
jgi:hypothetical protein